MFVAIIQGHREEAGGKSIWRAYWGSARDITNDLSYNEGDGAHRISGLGRKESLLKSNRDQERDNGDIPTGYRSRGAVPGKSNRAAERYRGVSPVEEAEPLDWSQWGELASSESEQSEQPKKSEMPDPFDWRAMQQPRNNGIAGAGPGPGVGHRVAAMGEAAAAAPTTSPGATPASTTVKVTVNGMFGGDLSATIKVEAQDKRGKQWKTVASASGTVTDSDGAAEPGPRSVSTDIAIERHKRYQITVTPTAAAPDDRYRKTSARIGDKASTEASINLKVNRWNKKNVDIVWESKGIDPDKARKTKTVTLLTRRVTVNELVVPRVDVTNAEFAKLSAEEQKEVVDSIVVMGGYAYRTTSSGGYSNHSTGCAVDVNYNGPTMQNHHFRRKNKGHQAILAFAQRVIRTDAAFSDYKIATAGGARVLAASKAFETQFPIYVADLLGTEVKAVELADINDAIAASKDAKVKKELQFISTHWTIIDAWVRGALVEDKVDKRDETLKGMVPIHENLLKVFATAGWSWGGNWEKDKDYMHFEDKGAMERLKK